jgi:small conductance mechanosensitive channel
VEINEELVESVVELTSQWGVKVIGAILLLFVGRMVCNGIRKATVRGLERAKMDASLVPFLSSMVYYLALAVLVIAVLNLFGIQTASAIAVLGAAGLAVGLALQGTLSNFSSGVMLLVFRPFKIGDYVEVAGTAGSVEEIGVFSTVLNTPDNVKITVPNSGIYGGTVKNYSANETRRNDLVMGISYDDDIQLAMDTIERVLGGDQRILADPEPVVAVAELGDSSVNIVVRPWCAGSDYWPLRFDLTRRLKEELEAAGCSIPYPQRDVHLQGGTGEAPPAA